MGPKKVLTAESLVTMNEASRGGRSTRQRLGSNYLNQRSFVEESRIKPDRYVTPVTLPTSTQISARSSPMRKDHTKAVQF